MIHTQGLKMFRVAAHVGIQIAVFAALMGISIPAFGQTKTKKTDKTTTSKPAQKKNAAPKSGAAGAGAPSDSATTTTPSPKPLPAFRPSEEDLAATSAGAGVQSSAPLPRSPRRPKTPLKFTAENKNISTTTGSLYGTLLVPETASTTALVPVVLILNSNTVYDRDGVSRLNGDSSAHAKLLAEALAAEGIASLRYDTRGIGKSVIAFINEEFHDFERTITDACQWIDSLRRDPRFSSVVVLGFGRPNDFGREGALAGIQAAHRMQADGLILAGAESRPWLRYLKNQAYATFTEASARQIDSVASLLENGERPRVTKEMGALYNLFRPTLQSYVLSLNKYNPVEEIAKLSIPIIAVHGTLDFTVGEEQTKALVAANPGAKFFSIKNMSFNLKDGNQDLSTPPQEKGRVPILPSIVDLFANYVWSLEKARP